MKYIIIVLASAILLFSSCTKEPLDDLIVQDILVETSFGESDFYIPVPPPSDTIPDSLTDRDWLYDLSPSNSE